MKMFTKTFTFTLFCLFFTTSLFSSNITIVESQSIHPLHKMDVNWKNIAQVLGQSATIVAQTFLDDYANLSNTDILIVSSGLIDIPENRKATILQFVQNGGNVYIQSEYLGNLPGNSTFKYIADHIGNSFNWEDEVSGNLSPMIITGDMATGLASDNQISYYWYGASGNGDEHFIPFLKFNSKNWGFVYCPAVLTYGNVITTSDQDWIRTSDNNSLMVKILSTLLAKAALNALPTVSITATDSPCDDVNSFAANIDNFSPEIELEWLVNGVVIANANDLVFASNTLNEGDEVECRIAISSFCSSYDHVSNPILIAPIFPIEIPEFNISSNNTAICQGQTTTFTANTTQSTGASNFTYQWLVNGAPVSGSTDPSFSPDFLNDGDLVTCQLTYDDLCNTGNEILSNEVSVGVTALVNPTLTITADLTEICEGELVTFTATGNNLGANPTYQWQVDGINTGDNNPVFFTTNLTNGQIVNCKVLTQLLCSQSNEANSNTISIAVNEIVNPGIEITASTDTICSGEVITFTAIASDFGANPNYQWQVDGLNVGTNQSVFSANSLLDGQEITCILTVAESCTNSAAVTSAPISIIVTQGSVPTLSILSNSTTICAGQSVTLSASGENIGNDPVYEWFVNGTSVGNNASDLLLDNVMTTQTITCSVFNPEGCPDNNFAQSNELTIELTMIEIEILELAAENCGNADGLIEVIAEGGTAPYEYEWSNGINHSLMTDANAGMYNLTVTDANGCTSTTDIEIPNLEGPQITDYAVVGVDCSGINGAASVNLENSTNNTIVEWTNTSGEVVHTGTQAENLIPGTYIVVVTNENGCQAFENILIEQIATISVTVENHVRVELGAEIRLQALVNSNEDLSYQWFPTDGLSCTDCPNPIANPVNTTEYTVIVTNEAGCTAINEIYVQVVPKDDVYVPNAFSPNGDGNNDYFTVFAGDNVAEIKTMRVFDRWGAQVFENQNFNPNNLTQGWDGTYKGKQMNKGVYVYYVEVMYINGSTKIIKGDLSITL